MKVYEATAKIHLGAFDQDLPVGGLVEVGDSWVKYKGRALRVPEIQGAIADGWLVESERLIEPELGGGWEDDPLEV